MGPQGQSHGAVIPEWTLTLMPEPGAMAVLCGGIVVLVAVRRFEGRRR
jgi:hypothetical protein